MNYGKKRQEPYETVITVRGVPTNVATKFARAGDGMVGHVGVNLGTCSTRMHLDLFSAVLG